MESDKQRENMKSKKNIKYLISHFLSLWGVDVCFIVITIAGVIAIIQTWESVSLWIARVFAYLFLSIICIGLLALTLFILKKYKH